MGNRAEFAPDFITSVGPARGLGARATSEFLENLRWTSFLLVYQYESDLEELAPLIYDRRSTHYAGHRASVQIRRLPNNTDHYEPFLKYVRNRLKQTNIVTNMLSTKPTPVPNYQFFGDYCSVLSLDVAVLMGCIGIISVK
ncbi:unnamed protein product [Cylicostephanus goldi]|uniref:Receptor ligand binding region domain-containing protein n=1 Tax=Cylicostephanus goldi TaxID=71465 RepID=A0A3P6RDP2_CYLGO|nr:unnamed protein product [Cylicostephanus goldi]